MKLEGLVQLIESTSDTFYEHLRIGQAEAMAEVQWIDQGWRFNPTPYQGKWTNVKTPLEIKELNLDDLEFYLTHWLLTSYAYFQMVGQEDSFEARRILKFFGAEVCAKAVKDYEDFGNALVETLSKHIKKPLKLI